MSVFTKKELLVFSGIGLIGVLLSVGLGLVGGEFNNTSFDDYSKDAEIYNQTAFYILDEGSFHGEDSLTVGGFRRAPGYPIFLALVYSVVRHPASVWVAQIILFVLSLFLFWRISKRFLPGYFSFLPPLLMALSWFIAFGVISIKTEILSVFLFLLFFWALFAFFNARREMKKALRLLISGFAISWFILIKPVALYLLPFILIFILYRERRGMAKNTFLFLIIPVILLGSYMIYTVTFFNTHQISGGYTMLAWRAQEATASWQRISASFLAGVAGDLVADQFFPRYADNPEPFERVGKVFEEHLEMKAAGIPEAQIEGHFKDRAIEYIGDNPVKYGVTALTVFFRLNTPMNLDGWPITHMFAETHDEFSTTQKIIIISLVRIVWYLFLAGVVYVFIKHAHDYKKWGLIIFAVLFWNGMHALLTHGEARYLLPILPFYILAFIVFVYDVRTSLWLKKFQLLLPVSMRQRI